MPFVAFNTYFFCRCFHRFLVFCFVFCFVNFGRFFFLSSLLLLVCFLGDQSWAGVVRRLPPPLLCALLHFWPSLGSAFFQLQHLMTTACPEGR